MSITLITGVPGTGKTASAVQMMTEYAGKRPIFSMGIKELKIDHQMVPPVAEWTERRPLPEDPTLSAAFFRFPPNSVIFIDECQTIYRPRPSGSKVPDYVAANETHRHTGVDFVLMTQHPSLIDANLRKFIARHIHIRQTPFGRYKHEWTELGDVDSKVSRELSRTDRFKPPKKVFHLYKSAELHTKLKVRLPWYFYVFIISLVIVALLGRMVYNRISGVINPDPIHKLNTSESSQGKIAVAQDRPLNAEEYVQQYAPRELGHPYTAPAYDELTKAQSVPEAVACYESERSGCKCLTQQGTVYETTPQICRSILHEGASFRPWARPEGSDVVRRRPEPSGGLIGQGEPFPPRRQPVMVDAEALHHGA